VLRAVVFDVDFTLARPGPDLGPHGYRELGRRHGLELDPSRYEDAGGAFAEVKRHPSSTTTRRSGFSSPSGSSAAWAARGTRTPPPSRWRAAGRSPVHFELYDDALPVLELLRERGLLIGLLSNSSRDLGEFDVHHNLRRTPSSPRPAHGKTKPHESIFRAILGLLDVAPDEAVMVGDTIDDDVEGARAWGCGRSSSTARALPEIDGALDDLRELPAALGSGSSRPPFGQRRSTATDGTPCRHVSRSRTDAVVSRSAAPRAPCRR
jgi:FMN phosphatase YigB (HAD superfamily)